MHTRFSRISIACLLASAAITACVKKGKDVGPGPTRTNDSTYIDSVTYTGCAFAGDIIAFSFRLHGTGSIGIKNMMWNYGDGTTSTSDQHIYLDTGTYTVTFTADLGVRATGQIHVLPYLPGSLHTFGITGKRQWTGLLHGVNNDLQGFDLTGSSGDTVKVQFAIDAMSGGIVKLPFDRTGITLNLITEDTVNKKLTFQSCGGGSAILQYFYDKDSIAYSNYWSSSVGHAYQSLYIHTL